MRERRWESQATLDFDEVLAVGERLAALGLKPADPAKDVICYVEEWDVDHPDAIDQLDPWPTEDVTLVLHYDDWRGDFFLLAGAFHTCYRRHQSTGTYCSVSHPWSLTSPLTTVLPRAMFWLGFRYTHSFIRIRLHTAEVITPGEHRDAAETARWVEDRRRAFDEAMTLLTLPIDVTVEKGQVVMRGKPGVALFCSWPDAFGPCQFEYNSDDPYEFLVPASRLAARYAGPRTVRCYLTGFDETGLAEFQAIEPRPRAAYRCSAHTPLDEVPELLRAIAPTGRLYTTLCELSTQQFLADRDDASAIIGIVGAQGRFQIEARLNRAPLPDDQMRSWLEGLLGLPMVYAPLPPFP